MTTALEVKSFQDIQYHSDHSLHPSDLLVNYIQTPG